MHSGRIAVRPSGRNLANRPLPNLPEAAQSASHLAYGGFIALTFVLMSVVRWEPAPVDLSILALLVILGLNLGFRVPIFQISIPLFMLLLLNVIVQVAAIGQVLDTGRSMRHWLITILMICYALVGYCVGQYERSAFLALRAFCVGAAISGFIAILAFFRLVPGFEIVAYTEVRLQGFFKDPNVLAPSSLAALVVAMDWLVEARGNRKGWRHGVPHYGMVLILVALVVLAASRASIGGALVTIAAYLVLLMFSTGRLKVRTVRTLIGVIVVTVLIAQVLPKERFSFIETRLGQNLEGDSRFHIQRLALGKIGEFPLLGHGPLSTTLDFGVGVHNVFVSQLYEYGIIGLALTLLVWIPPLVWSFRAAARSENPTIVRLGVIYFAVLLGQFANSMFIDSLHWRHLWFFIGAAWALPLLERRTNPRSRDYRISVGKYR